jgi:hypothetical protein
MDTLRLCLQAGIRATAQIRELRDMLSSVIDDADSEFVAVKDDAEC